MNIILAKRYTQAIRFGFATKQYDVVIIGGGPGGYVAAIKAAQLGLKTACVEKRGALGGTCLNVGCIPSKALLNISHKFEDANKHFKEMGIHVENLKMDWDQTLKKKTQIVTGLTKGIEGLFAKNKIDYLKGHGKFQSATEISVESEDGKTQTIQAKHIILATGSEPTPFPGLDFDEQTIISSTGALALKKIPKKLLVVGGGVIGTEMASVYSRLGVEVTVVEYFDRICPFLDNDIQASFQKILVKQGIKFLVGQKVTGGKNNGNSAELHLESVKNGEKQTLSADHILISTGRRPYTDKLGALEIGIKFDDKKRVLINEHYQTNIQNVFAIGDIVAGPMLAHKAEEEGIACVEHIAGKGGHVNYNAIPNVIYTNPELAWVGKTEEELKKEGVEYGKGSFPFLANSRAKAIDDYDGLIKVLTDKKTDKLLGVHILGPNAGELIAEAVLGMEYGASSEDISRSCHAHPTLSEALKEACMAAHSKAIHF